MIRVAFLAICCAGAIYGVVALRTIPEHARGGLGWRLYTESLSGAGVQAGMENGVTPTAQWFTQQLDHTGGSDATFRQRYYTNGSVYGGRGLVFFEIGGEGPYTSPPSGFIASLGAQHGAYLVGLEHRFYGESVPGKNFSTANLHYLTVNQALDDVKHFMDSFTLPDGKTPQFFVFGGSYSGALSAWFHVKYPGAAIGSLASSGVVNAILDFWEFDNQIGISAGPECAGILRATTAAFDRYFDSGQGAAMKALFNASQIMDDDFFYMIADSGAMAVQYGNKAVMCGQLPPADSSDETLVNAFANFTNSFWGPTFGSSCFYDTNCLINDPSQWQPTNRAWRWQKCYELAYFQVAPEQGAIRSQRVNMDYCLNQCATIFGIPNMMPSTAAINKQFGAQYPMENNTFYSNGSDDPWQRAAVSKTLSKSQPELTAVCDGCGHCGDLEPYANSTAVQAQRTLFGQYLTGWLSAAGAI